MERERLFPLLLSLMLHGAVIGVLVWELPSFFPEAPTYEVIWEKKTASPKRQEKSKHSQQKKKVSSAKKRALPPPSVVPASGPSLHKAGRREEVVASQSIASPSVKARQTHTPLPAYPWICRKRGQEGEVGLHLTLSSEGRVLSAQVEKSSGFSLLDEAALEGVKDWVLEEGPSQREVTLSFRLETGTVSVD